MRALHPICPMSFARVYPLYVAKAERKGRSQHEVDTVIRWLTGYSQSEVEALMKVGWDFETCFREASRMNPVRIFIRGLFAAFASRMNQNPRCVISGIWTN
jgi:hypothetical protein